MYHIEPTHSFAKIKLTPKMVTVAFSRFIPSTNPDNKSSTKVKKYWLCFIGAIILPPIYVVILRKPYCNLLIRQMF